LGEKDMRITDERVNELIKHEGLLASGDPVSETGVFRLAFDLRDARCRIRHIERQLASLENKCIPLGIVTK